MNTYSDYTTELFKEFVEHCKFSYYNTAPIISDKLYDELVEALKSLK